MMVEAQAQKEKMKELEFFKDFLEHLQDFIDFNSFNFEKPAILFIQEPLNITRGYYAKGLAKVWSYYFPFEVTFNKDLNEIEVESDIFYYIVKVNDAKKFLEERHEGELNEAKWREEHELD
jgi:hypothetical protein